MPIPRRSRSGDILTITMMELRAEPGEVFEAVRDGAIVRVTKQGKHVGTIYSPRHDPNEPTVIHSDGTWDGPAPLTFRRPELLRNNSY